MSAFFAPSYLKETLIKRVSFVARPVGIKRLDGGNGVIQRFLKRLCMTLSAAAVCLVALLLPARASLADILLYETPGIEEMSAIVEDREVDGAKWGALTVEIFPEGAISAGARWSADGGAAWRSSGETILAEEGVAEVLFSSVIGWLPPDPIRAKVGGDGVTTAAGSYLQLTGSLRVTIEGPGEARWRLPDGEPLQGGEMARALLPGEYLIAFEDVQGWLKPDDAGVTVEAGVDAELSAAYIQTASVTVAIEGPPEAEWSIDGGRGMRAGTTAVGLAPGERVITFKEVQGWETPEDRVIPLAPGQYARIRASYEYIRGAARKADPRADSGAERGDASLPAAGASLAGLPPQEAEDASITAEGTVEADGEPAETPEENPVEVEETTETPDSDERLVANPGQEPAIPVDPEPAPEGTPPPAEITDPTFALLDFNRPERERLADVISANRYRLDLGDARYSRIRAYDSNHDEGLPSSGLTEEALLNLADRLAPLMTRDSEGNEATPFILKAEALQFQTGERDITGQFLTVGVSLTVSQSELAAADPTIAARVEEAFESGGSLSDALLKEVRIFKMVGEGEKARLFDLAECARGAGLPLGGFFSARAKSAPGGFFDSRQRDASYVISFRALIFDGPARNPYRSVQPLEEGWFIIFDGLKDSAYSDPVILAALRPKSADNQGGSGCGILSGGADAVLLLLPALLLLRRSSR